MTQPLKLSPIAFPGVLAMNCIGNGEAGGVNQYPYRMLALQAELELATALAPGILSREITFKF